MNFRSFNIAMFITFLLVISPSKAELAFEDYQKLSRLPDSVLLLDDQARVAWLKDKIASNPITVEKYRLQRQLFYEFYWAGENELAKKLCTQNKPLKKDFYYRENCIEIIHEDFESYVTEMLDLIHEARELKDNSNTAELIANLAWRQSQFGDIGEAYQNYAEALALVPSDDILLLNTIMMDTATNYIVHGDEKYVNKGISLLEKAREQSLTAMEQSNAELRESLVDSIILASFNTGIAYTLHLHEYDKALTHFDKVNSIENSEVNPYLISALSFSSLAASEMGDVARAKDYLEQLGSRKDSQPEVEAYLNCYRQLAVRHWNTAQSLSSCLNLDEETSVEVQLDVYKRLITINDPSINLHGLVKLKNLFLEKLEPQLKSRGSRAASNTEIRRLQRESELKSVVLKQQEQLRTEREQTHSTQQKLFAAMFILMICFIFIVASKLRHKKKLAKQFQYMSITDPLTQLGNRRFFEYQIQKELAYIHRENRNEHKIELGIYIIDIDHFKRINDTYGHHAGDKVLQEISRRVGLVTRETDILVRWGGEEFLYVARIDDKERINLLADRILETISSEPFEIGMETKINVTCTIGVVKYPFIDTDNRELWSRLISLADVALYYGKMKQRNCWVMIHNKNITTSLQLDTLLKTPLQQAVEDRSVSIETSD